MQEQSLGVGGGTVTGGGGGRRSGVGEEQSLGREEEGGFLVCCCIQEIFYLTMHSTHLVKDLSEKEREPAATTWELFPISSKGSFYAKPIDRITHECFYIYIFNFNFLCTSHLFDTQ